MFEPTDLQQTLIDRYTRAKSLGVIMANTTGYHFSKRSMEINGKQVTSYASCSYLGFDLDERLVEGSVSAIRQYGTMFPTSRAYLQMGLYEELEARFEKIFGAPCLLGASTTLSHLSVFPSLVSKNDAIIVDRQGHNSLQDAITAMVGRGCHKEVVAHNNMVQLRERIEKLSAIHEKVWYVADGVYSIYGDVAPFAPIKQLLEDFPKLVVYIDDAHGMGWKGKYGRGTALTAIGHHERLIIVTSLGKAVATGGGVMVLPDQKTKELVRITGKTLMFSSPLTPGQLGAALAATEILLSDELPSIQKELEERCSFFLAKADEANLEIIDRSLSPIFYVAIGDYDILFEITQALQRNHSIFVTLTGYPAVARDQCGLRITVTRLHSLEDIATMVSAISEEYDISLSRRGKTREEFSSQFIKLIGS